MAFDEYGFDSGDAVFGYASKYTTERSDLLLLPEQGQDTQSTRVAQITFEGASYIVRRRCSFDRIIVRATAQTGAPTLRLLLYQQDQGASGVASRIATVTGFPIGAAGTFELVPTELAPIAQAGLLYVLWGRDSAAGSITMRSWNNLTVDLLNVNVPLTVHPTAYSTAIAATTTPGTFDPRTSPTGAAVPSILNVGPVLRLRHT